MLYVINIEINLIFLIKSFLLNNQKVKTRISISHEGKELEKIKIFFINFKGLSLKHIKKKMRMVKVRFSSSYKQMLLEGWFNKSGEKKAFLYIKGTIKSLVLSDL